MSNQSKKDKQVTIATALLQAVNAIHKYNRHGTANFIPYDPEKAKDISEEGKRIIENFKKNNDNINL